MANSSIRQSRAVRRIVRGQAVSDGAGAKLNRIIGQRDFDMLDPFLMLDEFRSDRAGDYLAGFPDHPHRGFETITYMIAGRMRHRDSAGNEGLLQGGGVQWMTAGRGVIHSEIPQQEDGVMEGGAQMTIDTHNLASGTYVVEVIGAGWRGTAKWTKVE